MNADHQPLVHLAGKSSFALVMLAVITTHVGTWTPPALGSDRFEQAPIKYSETRPNDPVAKLQHRISAGDVSFSYDDKFGYLASVLKELGVPVSSQALVFSKTSFQQKRISPAAPRAVYFNDNTYVGWVQGGDVEISAVDPHQGAMFYSLRQRPSATPTFVRHTHECLQCHSSSLTKGVPGHLVRSVYPDASGFPILRAGTFRTDHRSPLHERWGGWYVTGTHGSQHHMGNVIAEEGEHEARLAAGGENVTDLQDRVDTSHYLGPGSDIVALMVLEHQTQMHNLITRANYDTRWALHDAQVINRMLQRDPDELSPSTLSRIQNACESLLKYLLFVDEVELTESIQGTSAFARQFAVRGPVDSRGRSLRDLDLQRRMFKYPCSYLVYTEAFDNLPTPARDCLYRRLWEVLTGQDASETYAHLSSTDRRAILEILRDTKAGIPAYWGGES